MPDGFSFDEALIPASTRGFSWDEAAGKAGPFSWDEAAGTAQGTFEPTTGVYIPPNPQDASLAKPVANVLSGIRTANQGFPYDQPGYEYGGVLPFRKDVKTGEVQWGAVPEMIRAPLRGTLINPMKFDPNDPQQRADLGAAAAAFGGMSAAPGRIYTEAPGVVTTEADLRAAASAFPKDWREPPEAGAAPPPPEPPPTAPGGSWRSRPFSWDEATTEAPTAGPAAPKALTAPAPDIGLDDWLEPAEEAPPPPAPRPSAARPAAPTEPVEAGHRATYYDPEASDYVTGTVVGTRPDGRIVMDRGAGAYKFVAPQEIVSTRPPKPAAPFSWEEATKEPVPTRTTAPEPADVQPAPEPSAPIAAPAKPRRARAITPFVPVPKEPMRLADFLRQPTVVSPGTIHQKIIPGGIKDVGGDIAAMGGGMRRRGLRRLINNETGRSYNDALTRAWESGYWPEFPKSGYAPGDDNLLLERLEKDLSGIPQYSENDREAVEAHQHAIGMNAEINRLAGEHGLPTEGITNRQFFDRLHDKLSQDERAEELTRQGGSEDDEWAELLRESGYDTPDYPADERYGKTRSLEDLEDEYRQESGAGTPGVRQAGDARSGPVGEGARGGAEGVSPDDRNLGDAGRGGEGGGAPAGFAERPDPLDNPAFREWFGSSRVVDAAGNPLVVYHGTKGDIGDVFDPAKRGTHTQSGGSEHAFFFTSKPTVAETYAEKAPRQDFLAEIKKMTAERDALLAKRQAKIDDSNFNWHSKRAVNALEDLQYRAHDYDFTIERLKHYAATPAETFHNAKHVLGDYTKLSKERAAELGSSGGEALYPAYVSLQNPVIVEAGGKVWHELPEPMSKTIADAKTAGRDGVIFKDLYDPLRSYMGEKGQSDIVAVFHPTQIKSAIGNRGTFDPRNPSILAERKAPLPPPSGPDLFGRERTPAPARQPEPTIRTDPAQVDLFAPGEPLAIQRRAVDAEIERTLTQPASPERSEAIARLVQKRESLAGPAIQAQAARDAAPPRSGQEAPGGLFAPKPPEQPPLPLASKWKEPNFRDLLPTIPHGTGSPHDIAANWVFQQGRAAGQEHLAIVDNATGTIVHAGTSDLDRFVRFNAASHLKGEPAGGITVHHDHPLGTALSDQDVMMLSHPGIGYVVAHGHDGSTTIASLGPKIAKIPADTPAGVTYRADTIQAAHKHADAVAWKMLTPLVERGEITPDAANSIFHDTINRLIAADGIINYMSTKVLPLPVMERLRAHLKETGHADDVVDRSTFAVRPENRNSGLPRAVRSEQGPGQPAGAGGGGAGEGQSAPGGLAEYRDPQGREVLYSPVARAVDALPQAKGTGEQMLAQVMKTPGVKPEEVRWMGLDDWLRGQRTVTRAEIADFVRANQLEVREVVKGEMSQADAEARLQRLETEFAQKLPAEIEVGGRTHPGGDIAYYLATKEMQPGDLPEQYRKIAQGFVDEYHRLGSVEQDAFATSPKFGTYTLPGGSNYRELLITLPVKEAATNGEFAMKMFGKTWNELSSTETDAVIAEMRRAGATPKQVEAQNYRSPHWDEPNVLAHVRFDERTAPDGAKTLLIEEAQSDLHQAGRKHGYKGQEDKTRLNAIDAEQERMVQAVAARHPDLSRYEGGMLESQAYSRMNPTERARYDVLTTERGRELDAMHSNKGAAPNLPFKTSWPSLVMRRMIKYAVDNGFSRVAWVPGDVQAKRYELSNHVSGVAWSPKTGSLYIRKPGAEQYYQDERVKGVTKDNLAEYVGKEVADRMIANGPDERGVHYAEGNDLKVDYGSGMRGFYDKMLPNEVQKIVGKFGGKVSKSDISMPDKAIPFPWRIASDGTNYWVARSSGVGGMGERLSENFPTYEEAVAEAAAQKAGKQPVHSVDITDAMRKAIQTHGLGLFEQPGPFRQSMVNP